MAKWFNNGINEYYREECPLGCVKGRLLKFDNHNYNLDYQRRDIIIFNKIFERIPSDGYRAFENLTFTQLTTLLNENFINEQERHNLAPDIKTIIRFVRNNQIADDIYFDGYVIYPPRNDYRVSIDTITAYPANTQKYNKDKIIMSFRRLARYCDSKIISDALLRAWWT